MDKQKSYIKKFLALILFYGFIFTCLWFFFTVIHPLVVYDTDDWFSLANIREAVPLWHGFNPAKVLPETLLGLTACLGVYFIWPFTGDFLLSITYSSALIICIFILIYMIMFEKICSAYLLKNKDRWLAKLLSLIFLALHFLVLIVHDSENYHLFYSNNICNYYNYMIPALFNCCLVMTLMTTDMQAVFMSHDISYTKKGLYLMFIYFAIFSSIQLSPITAAFVGSILLRDLSGILTRKTKLSTYVKKNLLYLSIVALFFLSLIFEANGQRAGDVASGSFKAHDTLIAFASLILPLNRHFMIIMISFALFGIFALIKALSSEEKSRFISSLFWENLLPLLLNTAYLFLLCAVTKPGYMGRPDTVFGISFYGFVFVFRLLINGLNNFEPVSVCIPLLALICCVYVVSGVKSFREPNIHRLSPDKCRALCENLIEQLVTADKSGDKECVLHVPKYSTKDNWPYPDYSGDVLQSMLYKYNVLSRNISTTTLYDEAMNKYIE